MACGVVLLGLASALAGGLFCMLISLNSRSEMQFIDVPDASSVLADLLATPSATESMFLDHLAESHVREIPHRVRACLSDAFACPLYPPGQLEQDWRVRFQRQERSGCYFEFKGVRPSCPAVCEELFSRDSLNPDYGIKVAQGCKIGCSYAVKALQSGKQTCLRDCKATLWHFDPADQQCLGSRGLGLSANGVELDKACEMGCLIGNERPCPHCDERALHAATVDV
jgi:hypothetical protein